MPSLKSFLPKLSECLSVSPAALYERQRALVRLGILTGKEGRGPGSGVKLAADSLAALLASLLVTDNLSDVDDRVSLLLKATGAYSSGSHGLTADTFGAALGIILWQEAFIFEISVDRQNLSAEVRKTKKPVASRQAPSILRRLPKNPEPEIYHFLSDAPLLRPYPPRIDVTAKLDSSVMNDLIIAFLSAVEDAEASGQ
jgi:hypothetical protein